MTHALALLCLTLATATLTVQASPQKVERITAWQWCVRGDKAEMVKTTTMRVDGRDTEPREEILHRIEETNMTWHGGN
jgi:hypothetical protein